MILEENLSSYDNESGQIHFIFLLGSTEHLNSPGKKLDKKIDSKHIVVYMYIGFCNRVISLSVCIIPLFMMMRGGS